MLASGRPPFFCQPAVEVFSLFLALFAPSLPAHGWPLQLTHVSPVTIGVMYGTGLLMSLSPCALSLLPLTISYIAGSEAEGAAEEAAEGRERSAGGFESLKGGFVPSAAFAAGEHACLPSRTERLCTGSSHVDLSLLLCSELTACGGGLIFRLQIWRRTLLSLAVETWSSCS